MRVAGEHIGKVRIIPDPFAPWKLPVKNMKTAKLYKGKEEVHEIIFNRVWAMPNAWTFQIYPIQKLLEKYVGDGIGWIDPYAGFNSPAEFRNDIDPKANAQWHLDALEFAVRIRCERPGFINNIFGILYDPPYSFRQISEHYKAIGRKVTQHDTSMAFYEKAKSAFCELIPAGGLAISFGWNTNGFGIARGFRIIEIMAVAHGGSKNDTLVTVEQKINKNL